MEYAQQIIQYDKPTIQKFENLQVGLLIKSLKAGKNATPEAIRLLTSTIRLENRWSSLKEVFVKKTLAKETCYEKTFLDSVLSDPNSRTSRILKSNNIFPNLTICSRFSQIKAKWKKISFLRDKNTLNPSYFPILSGS